MQFDLNRISGPIDRRYDVCVIGAGAAGITVAVKLARLGKRVALCEGGAFEYDPASQDCYAGEVIGDPYFDLDAARLRYFGGSTNHWGGMSRSFDPVDFDRGYLGPEYRWPIGYDDLNAYLSEACDILEINDQFEDQTIDDRYGIKRIQFELSPPVRFGEKFHDEITASDKIDLYINANFTGFTGADRRVNEVVLSNYDGTAFPIRTGMVIMAMGGIENSRQLLWVAQRHGSAFFDDQTPIGRYWMEHPHFTLGKALVANSVSDHEHYAIAGQAQQKLGILNCGFRVEKRSPQTTKQLVRELACVAPKVGEWAADLAGRNLICGVRFRAAWEQAPVFENRVALSADSKDQFGIPTTELHWRKTALDRKTIELSCDHLNLWLLDSELGRLRLNDWVYKDLDYPERDELAGYHHMGGTRMSTSARYGVVDGNCRMFGSENIYIAGSSLFTTGGHNNPTLPLVQLSLRLAEHLGRIV